MLEGHQILIVDDEENMREMLADLLGRYGAAVSRAGDLASARARIDEVKPEVVLLDLKLPDGNGLDLLRELGTRARRPAVILISAFGNVATAVQSMRSGAFDFIVKPFNIDDILRVVRSALVTGQPMTDPGGGGLSPFPEGLVGESPELRAALAAVDQIASSDAPVLIRGESGTGKELVARAIHLRSPRRAAPLMPINCAAIPEPLLESELFGYEKGAFSGAFARHAGKIDAAYGGTVFLDEVGDMSPALQAKLLRALEENQLFPVGATLPVRTDVRFLAATHRDLEKAVREGDFREDLYFRLNVLSVALPLLRDRSGDIPLLIEHFLGFYRRKYRKPDFTISPDLYGEMSLYPWPGNVRELRNVVEKLVLMGDAALSQLPWRCFLSTAAGGDRPPRSPASDAGRQEAIPSTEGSPPIPAVPRTCGTLAEVVKAAERSAIVEALNECRGNRRLAAERLGISYKTLFNKLHEHGIQVKTRAN
ncbi:MAG: sigma-54-dependent Fis family transcriptional regulator [Planctomycetes bacterium]|nr:sigma-54-dependent Fis family transcriptional regulator [Planctomycetota bacterium]